MNPLLTVPDLLKAPVRSLEYGFLPSTIYRYPVLWIELERPINVLPGQRVWLLQNLNGVRPTRPLIIEDIEGTRIIFKERINRQINSKTESNNFSSVGLDRKKHLGNRSWNYGTGQYNLFILYQDASPIRII